MYKNIIFDFGGVVVNFNPKDFLMDHFMNRRAEEETYDIVFGSQEWQDLDRGIITREEANKIMLEKAAHANRVFEVQTCLDEWFTMLETNKTTVQIMRKPEGRRVPPVLPDEHPDGRYGRAAPAGVVLAV